MTGDGSAPSEAGLDLPFAATALARPSQALSRLGRALTRGGLTPGAMYETFGLRYANRLAIALLPGVAAADPVACPADQAAVRLFVAGQTVPRACAETALGDAVELLLELELLSARDGAVAATASILPIGSRLVCCDLPGAPWQRATVPAPDLSAYHVLRAVCQRRVDSWLDIATGSGSVLLAGWRAERGRALGTDLNPRALAFARLGAGLSGLPALRWQHADLFEGLPPQRWRVITCNPPLDFGAVVSADDDELPLFLAGRPGLVAAFWREVGAWLDPKGEVVVHTPFPPDPDYPRSLGLPGQVLVRMWRVGADAAFCTTAWRPGGPPGARVRAVQAALP